MVDDIITNNSSVIFILESPHTNEVAGGIPLLGDSGVIFSRALLPDKETPAGLQIKQGNIPFSVMNTFQNALQLSPELSSLNTSIKNLDFEKLGFIKYRKCVRNLIKETPHAIYLVDSYKKRIKSLLDVSVQTSKVVVCGITAQVYFEDALSIFDVRLGRVATRLIMDKNVSILYVEHPSPKSNNTHWTPSTNNEKLDILQRFVNG